MVNNNTSSLFYARGSGSLKEVWKKPSNLVVSEGLCKVWPKFKAAVAMELDFESRRLASCIAFSIRRAKLRGHVCIAPYLEQALHILVTSQKLPAPTVKISLFNALHDTANGSAALDIKQPGTSSSASQASQTWRCDFTKSAHDVTTDLAHVDGYSQTSARVMTEDECNAMLESVLASAQSALASLSTCLERLEASGSCPAPTLFSAGAHGLSAAFNGNVRGAPAPHSQSACQSAPQGALDAAQVPQPSLEKLKTEHRERRLAEKEQRRQERMKPRDPPT